MGRIIKILKANKYLISIWIFLAILILFTESFLANIYGINNIVQITLFIISAILSITIFISFYFSIRKQKISYFVNTLITVFIFVLLIFISQSEIGSKIIDEIRGKPKITANFRGIYLVLRSNSNFDIWKPALLNRNIISSGSYKIQDNEIILTYECEIPNYFSTVAKVQNDEAQRRVVRFYFSDKTKFDYYVTN